jgi:hypothetical protein
LVICCAVFPFFLNSRPQALRAPDAAAAAAHAKRVVSANAAAACGFFPGLLIGITR